VSSGLPGAMSGPSVDPAPVADALWRVVAAEGPIALADASRLRGLLMDELGAEGRRQQTAVDALAALVTDLGGRLAETPPGEAARLLDGWSSTQQRLAPAPGRWAAGAVATALGVNAAPPPGAPPPPPPPPPVPTRPGGGARWLALGAALLVVAVAAGAVGFVARSATGGGSTTTSTTSSTSTTTSSTSTSTSTTTSTTAPARTVWADDEAPSAVHRTLLDQIPLMFVDGATCKPIGIRDLDPLGTYPQGPDEGSIECTYAGQGTVVFSLFATEAAMADFFEGRLRGREMAHGTGRIGTTPPWEIDYTNDSERGSGSIFGFQRTGAGARSEVGWIRTGTRTYAYSYALGDDYAAYYRWWAARFGGPAPPG